MKELNKVLVTGATGFLGAYLVRLLLMKGYKVRGLKRVTSTFELLADIQDKVEWVDADITDIVALEEAFEGVTFVCHCAAIVSFHPRDMREMHLTNVSGTANIVNLCLLHKVKKLIHVSSIAALGRSKERIHLDEKCPWVQSRDNTNYAITKHLAEQEVWRGIAEGLQAVIVLPAIIVGSQSWDEGMAAFFQKIDQGLKFCPTGQSGFVDVRDVVIFMECLLHQDIKNERFILSAVNISHRAFFGMIASTLEVTPPKIMVGPLLVELAWRVEWLKEKLLHAKPMVTKESARASITNFIYHNDKSSTVDGFAYRALQNTVSDIAVQYKDAKGNGFIPATLHLP
jgi:nucleoside-diphosphate-sugar epimerase